MDDDYNPDWWCLLCGSSGLHEDGPAECDCPDGPRSTP